jgi:MYXO-CTERM domain-containing protein
VTHSHRSLTAALALLVSGSALGADLTIRNTNSPGAGFNNSTPATLQGLNFGTTTGEQALVIFDTAAAIWGATIRSSVPIVIDSAFVSPDEDARFTCTSDGTVLGYARLTSYQTSPSFPNPQAGYVAALANALAGQDLTPGDAHIEARFNSGLGTAACPNTLWSFAPDGTSSANNQISLITTLLHEFGHGLGYTSFVDSSSGTFSGSTPAIFDFHTFDVDAGTTWATESAGKRKTLAVTPGSIGFDGDAVRADMPRFLGFVPSLSFTPAGGTATTVNFAIGRFSGPFNGTLSGPVAPTSPADACTDLAAGSLTGKIALIARGTCTFIAKTNRAVAAGAIGVIIYDNAANNLLVSMQGSPEVSIPAVFVSQADGQAVVTQLNAGAVTATFTLSTQLSNADASQSRVLLYTPSTLSPGSSVSHWNVGTFPRTLLMEYAIEPDIRLNMDLTPAVMADLGWSVVQGLSVSVVKALNPLVPAGGESTYIIAVVNRRTTGIAGAALDLTFPPGATVVSSQGACTGTFPCTLGAMASGDIQLVVTRLRAPAGASGTFPVTATLTPSTTDAADNLTATSTEPVATGGDVQVSVTAPAGLTPGAPASFKVTVTNAGPGDAADVRVTGSAAATDGTQLPFNLSSGGCITPLPCAYNSLASGATLTFSASYTIPTGFEGTATFTATVTTSTPDPTLANNAASASASTTTVTPPPTSASGCTTTGQPVSLFGLLGLALALALRRRSVAS